jgi:hypothetical protein
MKMMSKKERVSSKKMLSFIVLICLILQICNTFERVVVADEPQTYYVTPNGDDANAGDTDHPWRTIQHAADTMVAGDTVLIRNGVYHERVRTGHEGDVAGGYIVFSAYPGETPVIDGTGVDTGNNGFGIDHSYIKISGLEICNWPDNGIIGWNAGYLEISDCKIHDVGGGIGLFDGTHDFSINRIEMYGVTMGGFDASPAGGADCYNGVINDCVVRNGRDPEQNCDGFGLGHGEQRNFVFNRCEVFDVFDGFDMSSRDTQLNSCSSHDNWNTGYKIWEDNVTLTNCLGYHNEGNNLQLTWNGNSGTVTLRNCDFVDSQVDNIWVENPARRLHMYNCILAGGDNVGLDFEQLDSEAYRGDFNILHNDNPERAIVVRNHEPEFSLDMVAAGDWNQFTGQDEHSIVCSDLTSQLFKDLANWDFRLKEASIAIDAGTSDNAPKVDYNGFGRPQGTGFDIGAYEYGSSPTASSSPTKTTPGITQPVSEDTNWIHLWPWIVTVILIIISLAGVSILLLKIRKKS